MNYLGATSTCSIFVFFCFSYVYLFRFDRFRRLSTAEILQTSKKPKILSRTESPTISVAGRRLQLRLTFVRTGRVVITGSGRVVRRPSVHGDSGVGLLLPVESGGRAVRGEAVLRRRLVGPAVRRRHLLRTQRSKHAMRYYYDDTLRRLGLVRPRPGRRRARTDENGNKGARSQCLA